eukprot:COSAG01_NODE_10020_length_2273_cov_4.396504_1_plen_182_part_10
MHGASIGGGGGGGGGTDPVRAKLEAWLGGVPIGRPGGAASTSARGFEPAPLVAFAHSAGVGGLAPEEIYRLFVENRVKAVEEQEHAAEGVKGAEGESFACLARVDWVAVPQAWRARRVNRWGRRRRPRGGVRGGVGAAAEGASGGGGGWRHVKHKIYIMIISTHQHYNVNPYKSNTCQHRGF